jgi:hypothetical protein
MPENTVLEAYLAAFKAQGSLEPKIVTYRDNYLEFFPKPMTISYV